MTITKKPFIYVRHIKQHSGFESIDWDRLVDIAKNPFQYDDEKSLADNKFALPMVGAHSGKKKKLLVALKSKFQHLRLDLDDMSLSFEGVLEGLEKLGIERFILHTSISHLKHDEETGKFKGNRYRLFIDLADQMNVDDWKAMQHMLSGIFGADGCTDRPQQCVYLPCKTDVYQYHIGEGEPLDVNRLVGDESIMDKARQIWAEKEEAEKLQLEERRAMVRKSQEYIDGTITPVDFMRTIPMEEILERYAYKFVRSKRMWLSPNSTSGVAGGSVFLNEHGNQCYFTFSESDIFHSSRGAIDQFEMIARMECNGSHEEAAHFVRDNIMPKHIVEQSDEAFLKSRPDYVDNSEYELTDAEQAGAANVLAQLKGKKVEAESSSIEGELMPKEEGLKERADKLVQDSNKLAERIRNANPDAVDVSEPVEVDTETRDAEVQAQAEAEVAATEEAFAEGEVAAPVEPQEPIKTIPAWADPKHPQFDPEDYIEREADLQDNFDNADLQFEDESFIVGERAYDKWGREVGGKLDAFTDTLAQKKLEEIKAEEAEKMQAEALNRIGFNYSAVEKEFDLQGVDYDKPPSLLGTICEEMYKMSFRPLRSSYPLYGLHAMSLIACKYNVHGIDNSKFGLMTCLIAESASGKDTAQQYLKEAAELLGIIDKVGDKPRTDKDLAEGCLRQHSLMFIIDEAHTLMNQTGKNAAAYQQNLIPEIMKVLTDKNYIPSRKHSNAVQADAMKEVAMLERQISDKEESIDQLWESLLSVQFEATGKQESDEPTVEDPYPIDADAIISSGQNELRTQQLTDQVAMFNGMKHNLKKLKANIDLLNEVIERCRSGVKHANVNFAMASTPVQMSKGLVTTETMADGFMGRMLLIRCPEHREPLRPRAEIQKKMNNIPFAIVQQNWEHLLEKDINCVRMTGEAELMMDRITAYFDQDSYRNHNGLGSVFARLPQRVISLASVLGLGGHEGKVDKDMLKWCLVAVLRSIADINYMAQQAEMTDKINARVSGKKKANSDNLTPNEAMEIICSRVIDVLSKQASRTMTVSRLKQRVFKPKELVRFSEHSVKDKAIGHLIETNMIRIDDGKVILS